MRGAGSEEPQPYYVEAPAGSAPGREQPTATGEPGVGPGPGGLHAPWPGPLAWGPPPPGWTPPPAPSRPRPTRRFSGLCAGGLAAGVASFVAIATGSELGSTLVLSMFAVLLSGGALVVTWEEHPTNQWMAFVGLLAGLAPFGVMYVLAAILSDGLFGT